MPPVRPASYHHRVPRSARAALGPHPAAVLLAPLLAAIAVLAGLLGAPAAHAEDSPTAPGPVRLLLVTSGLTWEGIDAEATPTLQCLADRSGVGAMTTTSTTPVSTRAQGAKTLRTGYRGLAVEAPRSSGIPNPPVDRLPAPPAGPQVIDLPSVSRTDRAATLADLDARLAEALAPHGGCGAADLPRTLLVSVGAVDSADEPAGSAARGGAAQLQAVMDSARPGQALTSGATHQSGVVVLTDVLPTVLHDGAASVPAALPGQPITGQDVADAQRLATDRTQAARLVDRATIAALGSWVAPGVLGLVVLALPALARRPRLAAPARAVLTVAPLCIPVGLCAALVPWWRGEHPVLHLTAWVWAGSLALAAITLLGPWRRSRLGPPGVAGALVAALVLAESAAGSPLQLGSPLGAQAISGGRFYGLSNHLFGAVLAGALLALLALLSRLRSRAARVAATIAVGLVVAGVCVAPSMGADFGSMLVAVPTFGILALAVSGIRVRAWHVLALGAGGAAAVMAVSYLDWLRPPEQRTHLGRFIDAIASGELVQVVVRKLAQNVAMLTGIWPLAVVVAVALALTVAMLMPRRARLDRLAALDAACPQARPVRVALAVGAWLGYAVNDTGPVLVAAMLGIALALLMPMLPAPGRVIAPSRGTGVQGFAQPRYGATSPPQVS